MCTHAWPVYAVAIGGPGSLVLAARSLSAAVMALSAMGTILGVLFIVLAAPDVALAEVVVGAIATPVLYLIAIGKIRTDVVDRGDIGESAHDAESGSVRD